MDRTFFILGALLAALAVGAGAFGAHALRGRLAPELAEVFETAARYQTYHALALLAAAWAVDRWSNAASGLAGWLFLGGSVVFCGTLYLISFGGPRWLGAITPLGGVAFLAGWIALAWAAWQGRGG
jgi:uncharacterized membrane protein YgdD (TMEM256/DUF423 family)